MNTPSAQAQSFASAVSNALHRHWGWFLVEGILLLLLGIAAIAIPVVASVAVTLVFGWVLLVSGIVGLITTFRARGAPGFAWSLISGILGVVAGGILLWWPLQGTFSLTAVLIAFLFIEGIATLLYSLEHRKSLSGRWGWLLTSGIVDIILGVVLFLGLPWTALWALGVLVGINLLFGGWALIAVALSARAAGAQPRGAALPS